jgi:murein DD-endopeptidase MepM/ murein hydrolase activator NlpD
MNSKITIMACGTHAGPLRRITVPRWLFGLMACLLIAVVAGVAAIGYDYSRLRSVVAENQVLTQRIVRHKDQISHQQKQIEAFADEINALQARLVALCELESRIRILAGLDAESSEGMLGIGGVMPSDLSATSDPSQNHGRLIRKMHERIETLDSAADVGTERFEDLLDGIGEKHNMLACRPSIRPTTGYVTSAFGRRRSPFTGEAEMHSGLDIANRRGTPVMASADGTVVTAGRKGALGRVIEISHGYGMVTRYGHLDRFAKSVGDRVKRGEVVGFMGDTGRSTGPHLHYEVHLNGAPLNPEDYILN